MSLAELMKRQQPLIQKIIDEETLKCSRLRGAIVGPDDPEVQERVCEIILRIGAQIRQQAMAA